MNFLKGLMVALVLVTGAVAAEPPQPSFSQASKDAFFSRTKPWVGSLPPPTQRSSKRYTSKKNRSSTRRSTRKSSSKKNAAAEKMKRENCAMMRKMYDMSVKGGGVVAIDRNGKEFILKGPRAAAAIANAKKEVARWCT